MVPYASNTRRKVLETKSVLNFLNFDIHVYMNISHTSRDRFQRRTIISEKNNYNRYQNNKLTLFKSPQK